MPNDMTISLHEYFIRLLEEHEKRQDAELAAMDKALTLARCEAEKQYQGLNNLKHEYQAERAQFLSKNEYSIAHEALRNDVSLIHSQLDKLDSRIATWGAAIGLFVVLLQIASRFLWR